MQNHIPIPYEALDSIAEKYAIVKLAFFGSILREDFRPDSDIDMLVEFTPDSHMDLFRYAELIDVLTELFGRQVDLHTYRSLSRHIRDKVLANSEGFYERKG